MMYTKKEEKTDEKLLDQINNVQCITKVNTPITFLQIFKYISSWDNTDKMTL